MVMHLRFFQADYGPVCMSVCMFHHELQLIGFLNQIKFIEQQKA